MSTSNVDNTPALQKAIMLLIETFDKYAENQGDRNSLTKADVKTMLTIETNYLGNAQDKEAVDKVMGDLDSNKDKEVDFPDYINMVGAIAVARKDSSLKNNKKAEKKK